MVYDRRRKEEEGRRKRKNIQQNIVGRFQQAGKPMSIVNRIFINDVSSEYSFFAASGLLACPACAARSHDGDDGKSHKSYFVAFFWYSNLTGNIYISSINILLFDR